MLWPIAALCVMLLVPFSSCRGEEKEEKAMPPTARVEAEEEVYTFQEADNGAGPLWCYGSSCIVRVGKEVYISGIETLPEAKPLNNVRWLLFRRTGDGWRQVARGEGRTREPCPLACFQDDTLLLSDNPTLTGPEERNGPARPEIHVFSASAPDAEPKTIVPSWEDEPPFTEHSYRSFAADSQRKELILFQNVGYTHAEWTFRDASGRWSAHGRLKWPWGAEYPKPQPIRVCYPSVALKNRAVYFCGVSDIVEPYPEWREYKRKLTGREWDYDFRRLFFTWSDDITTGKFHDWIEVASRDKTCGWIFPCDLWVDDEGAVHLLWTERALDERLRDKFFPGEKQSHALMYAVLKDGKIALKRPILLVKEGESGPIPKTGRFQVDDEGRLYVFYYVEGRDENGEYVSENRLTELLPDGRQTPAAVVPLKHPFRRFFTATWRSGSPRSRVLDIYGFRAGDSNALSYARIHICGPTDE